MKHNQTRRAFIRRMAAGTAGIGLVSSIPAYSYARIVGANDRIRIGVVGFSDRFRSSLFPAFMANAGSLNCEIVAVSDIWNRRREEGASFLSDKTGNKVQSFRNNDELYDSKQTDAVIISTADFQHALHAVDAVRAGQDVYVEKPFANTMADANLAYDVIGKSDRVFQVGTQRRSSPKYMAADEYIKSGKFGSIVMAEMTWNVNQPDRWRRPELVSRIKETDTDWQRYLLNRPHEAWDPRKYLEYRLFWPYSSGIPDQWMVHQIDTVHWFTGLPYPRSVAANGGIYLWNDGRTNFDTMTAVFDYGPFDDRSRGFQVVYSSRQTNSAGDVKEIYYSNGGMLNLDTGKVTPDGGLESDHAEKMGMKAFKLSELRLSEGKKVETGANTGGDADTTAHMYDWLVNLGARKPTHAGIEAAYNHSVALCMTIAALHTGQRVTFDAGKKDVAMG